MREILVAISGYCLGVAIKTPGKTIERSVEKDNAEGTDMEIPKREHANGNIITMECDDT